MVKSFLPYTLGAYWENGYLYISFISKQTNCGVILYDKDSLKEVLKIQFDVNDRIGNMVFGKIAVDKPDKLVYQIFENEKIIADPFGKVFVSKKKYGEEKTENDMYAMIPWEEYEWGADGRPKISYEEALVYLLHVRGFTAHSSSKVKNKGTFAGVIAKIPYLKELGVTTIEFQPMYEFLEKEAVKKNLKTVLPVPERLNYWGYKKGYYFAPKSAYSSNTRADVECKDMIRILHENGMEAVLQFYFPKEYTSREILEILRFWVIEYHVDGFHIMGENISSTEISKDPFLADIKMWFAGIDENALFEYGKPIENKKLALYEDNYLYDMRKLLKGDENMMNSVLYHMRHIPKNLGKINFLSNYYGFTLWDCFSYDYKHNEENGEENRDGSDYNCSWNCGEEGTTRKKKINQIRRQLYKNAVCLLLFSAGTPLIFMGDEFANSQQGNNNPYCQDNEITWLNWKDLDKNKELYEFFTSMVKMKKEYHILCPENELKVMDYQSVGYPDLSYHGLNAWKPQMDSYSRQMGIMYCGKYADREDHMEEPFIYIGFNMHWVMHDLALPRLPKGNEWNLCVDTSEQFVGTDMVTCTVPPRSVSIFISRPSVEK